MKTTLIVIVVFCQQASGVYWTKWMSKNIPNPIGVFETIGIGPKPCGFNNAQLIQVRTGNSVRMTMGHKIDVGPHYGFKCDGSSCEDFKVKYGLWNTGDITYTKWYDVDTPGNGDDERIQFHGSLNGLGDLYKYSIHVAPVGRSSSHGYTYQKLELGPKYGLRCFHSSPPTGNCPNYQVRYLCPGVPFIITSG